MAFELPAWPPAWPEIGESVRAALSSGDWGRYQSDLCNRLRDRLCDQFDVADCRLTASGSAAIELALRASRVGPGDEVIVAAYDYPGNFRTIELLGARPVLVDVAPGSACIDANQIESAASDKVVAVIASHLYGRAAEVQSLRQICQTHQWILIEDACQVPGMMIDQRPAGCFGDLAALSFGGSKPITSGTGGALLINNDRLAARLPAIIERPSDVFPLSPLQAAVIGPQLDRLAELNQRRWATAKFLIDQLPEVDWISRIQPGVEPAIYKLAWKTAGPRSGSAAGNDSLAGAAELPIGKGFRSMAKTSDRRCRKPVPLDRSVELSNHLCVLDHRALLVEPSGHAELAELVRRAIG